MMRGASRQSSAGDAAAAARRGRRAAGDGGRVLHLLENEPQSCKSRIVQWWHCENKLDRLRDAGGARPRPPADDDVDVWPFLKMARR